MSNLQSTLEGLPGYDIVMDAWNEYAGEKFQTKDPYFEELPDGSTRRRKAPEGTTPSDAAVYKRIVSSAWKHDRCMCGCFWADWGLGQAPLISLIPVFGPWIMYTLHLRLNTMAEDLHIPSKLHAKMAANVTFDFLITLIPILGAIFSYLNACSTRNAALVHTYLMKKAKENQASLGDYRHIQTTYTRSMPTEERFRDVNVPPVQPTPNPYPHVPQPTRTARPETRPQRYQPQPVKYQPISYDGPKVKNKGRSGPLETGVR